MKNLAVVLLSLSMGAVVHAADPPPAVFKNGADLIAAVKKAAETNSDQVSANVSNTDKYRINVVRRGQPGIAMAHATGPAKGTEVHYIIDGAATVVTGGTIVRSGAGAAPSKDGKAKGGAATIQGGETRRVVKGDVVVIPAGTPHWYKEVEGSVTYLEVRFDVE